MSRLISKSSLIDLIKEQTGLPTEDVKKILTSILNNIHQTLTINGGVNVRGLGRFGVKHRNGRKYRSFQGSEVLKSKDQIVPVFKPSTALKEKCAAIKPVDLRKKSRREFIFELEVYDESNHKLGELGDITPKGLMLISQRHLEAKRDYQLKIKFPELIVGYSDWSFKAKCVWSLKSKLDETYDHGFKIKNISKNDQKIIDELLLEYGV